MYGVHVECSAEIEEIEVLGDWAFLRNRLTITVTPDGSGEAMLKRPRYTLLILRKAPDGRWLLARDANLIGQ